MHSKEGPGSGIQKSDMASCIIARPTGPRVRAFVGCIALALWAGSAAAAEITTERARAARAEKEARQRRIAEALLGPDRWRRLDAARFQIGLRSHAFTPALADDPDLHDEVARILVWSLGRMAQKGLQRRFRLYERRDELRARVRARGGSGPERRSRTGLDLSPRLRLGDRPWLGVKLGLRGAGDGLWSRTSLRLGSELDGGDPSVKLAFKGDTRRAFLVYHADHERRGEAVELQIGLSF